MIRLVMFTNVFIWVVGAISCIGASAWVVMWSLDEVLHLVRMKDEFIAFMWNRRARRFQNALDQHAGKGGPISEDRLQSALEQY